MRLLSKLFGTGKPQPEPYVESALSFVRRLAECVPLSDWRDGSPGYTESEMEAIALCQAQFKSMADSVAREHGGRETLFHPDTVEPVTRMLAEIGLKNLADEKWKYTDSVPQEWRFVLSTYLKAFMCNLNPLFFLDIGELLVKVGRTDDARSAVMVTTRFSAYARSRTPAHWEVTLVQSMSYLFRDKNYREAYSGSAGLYTPSLIKWLSERARIIDWMAQGK